jgi:hypothetical protein
MVTGMTVHFLAGRPPPNRFLPMVDGQSVLIADAMLCEGDGVHLTPGLAKGS